MNSASQYFPVASCSGLAGAEAAPYDRRWLVVDSGGRWLTQRDNARLAEVSVAIRFGYLVMRAPGMVRMDIPLDVIEDDDSVRQQVLVGEQSVDAVDEGELAATWLSNFTGTPCRLVKVHPDAAPVAWPAS